MPTRKVTGVICHFQKWSIRSYAMPYNSSSTVGSSIVSYQRMPVPTTSRYSTTSSSSYSRSGVADRPYYSSSTGSYSRTTLPRSPLSSEYRSSYSASTSTGQSRQSSLSEESSTKRSTSREPTTKSRTTDLSTTPTRRLGTVTSHSLDSSDFYSKYSPTNYVPNQSIKRDESAKPPIRRDEPKLYGRTRGTEETKYSSTLASDEKYGRSARPSNDLSYGRSSLTRSSEEKYSRTRASPEVNDTNNVLERKLSVAEIRKRFDRSDKAVASELAVTISNNTDAECNGVSNDWLANKASEESSEEEEEAEADVEEIPSVRVTRVTNNLTPSKPAAVHKSWRDTIDEDLDCSTSSGKSHAKRSNGLTGLINIGNTCFMNSVIQCLSNTKPLNEYLLSDSFVSDLNVNSSMKGKLITSFSDMLKDLWGVNENVASPVAFKAQISKYAPRFMGYAQQDAQEFLRFLLEGVHEDVNRVKHKPRPVNEPDLDDLNPDQKAVDQWKRYLRQDNSKIVDLFVGQLRSTLRCSVCGHCSVTFDPFWDIQLPIPSRTGQMRLQQCLDHFTTEEVLDGNEKAHCAKCEKNQKSTKSFTIQKFPKILVLQLNRFSPMDRFRRKLSVTIDFPIDNLDLSNYSAVKDRCNVYNLYGVSNHSGSCSFGHYTAYCKHPYSGEWHQYNDSRVSPISPRSVVSSEAYLLFYEQTPRSSNL